MPTQLQLAERAGTSHSFVSKLERGDHIPTIPVLQRIVRVLDEDLLIGIERRVDDERERQVAPVPSRLTAWRLSDALVHLCGMLMPMATNDSPVGATVAAEIERNRRQSRRYREADDRLAPFEQIARVVIMRRAELGLSQQEVAERMGTTTSVISRIERGQHRTSAETLRRLAEALEGHAVFGFEFGTAGHQELVRL